MDTVLNKIKTLTEKQVFLIVLIIYLTCAVFSSGFQHPDEHFQIFPILMYKSGNLDFFSLPWEFPSHMRSFLMPAFFWVTSYLPMHLDVGSPFTVLILSRLIIGAFSVWATYLFCKIYFKNKEVDNKLAFLFCSLIWFVPLLHVRTSSENFSFILYLFGLGFAIKEKRNPLWAFFFFYLSFHARFQMCLMIFGYLIFAFKNKHWRDIPMAVLGTLFALVFSLLIDRWGYGVWTYTPYNYFFQNIILKKAASFGESPPWYYLYLTMIKSWVVFFPLLSYAFYRFVKEFKWDILSCITVPFVFGHFFISHKELRFLNAFYFFIPFFLLVLWIKREIILPKVFRPQNGYFVLNTFFLIAIALLPASKDECFYSSLSKNLKNEQKLYVDDANFKLEMTFLNDRKISLKGEHPNSSSNFYFLTTNVESFENYLKNPNCNLRYSTYSKFVLDFLPKKIKDRSSILALFYCSVL